MYIKVPIGNLSRDEWLKLRKTGIGGSDAEAICRLNPYGSAMKVFLDKVSDETENVDSEAMRQGGTWRNMWRAGLWKKPG